MHTWGGVTVAPSHAAPRLTLGFQFLLHRLEYRQSLHFCLEIGQLRFEVLVFRRELLHLPREVAAAHAEHMAMLPVRLGEIIL